MKCTIISGSHRQNSQSEKISRYILSTINKTIDPEGSTELVSLAGNPVPLWDESYWSQDPKWEATFKPISDTFKSSDAFVLVVPEWGGMIPSGVHNLFHFCGGSTEFAHKPCMIVGVSSSRGGAYPVAELRLLSSKNTRIVYIPDHVIVRDCEQVLNSETSENEGDTFIRKRLEYSLNVLKAYSAAFNGVRESGVVDLKSHPFGM